MRRMSFEGSTSGNKEQASLSVLVMNKVGDVAAVVKVMELTKDGPSPSSKMGILPTRDDGESANTDIKQVDLKLKVRDINEDPVTGRNNIHTRKKRAASVKLR